MRRELSFCLLAAGLLVTGRPAARTGKRWWNDYRDAQTWRAFHSEPMRRESGEPYVWLSIPQAGIDELVLRGATAAILDRGPGGQQIGRAQLIMAHRDLHFRRLGRLTEGGLIHLAMHGGSRRTYRCSAVQVVEKERIESLLEAYRRRDVLLLLTCYPFRFIGPAPQRYLVIAEPVSPSA